MRFWVLLLLAISLPVRAADATIDFGQQKSEEKAKKAMSEVQRLSGDIQALKTRVIGLNKDLRVMEEALLFPTNTQFSVFVSTETGQFFTLESIKLKIDDKMVSSHLYSARQRDALARGGVQKLFMTNLSEGKHEVTAFFTGIGPNGRPYKRAAELTLEKGQASQYLEIAVRDDSARQEPVFEIKQW
ncbi:AraC family transcriptional regulator [Thalassolituus sp. LLYu03]|uniref:AraC family transcriptional regulator n=1 Tax=Thalassolituus sp. LLYu03 TaxID=3421656 RepID=UPI003D2C3D39